MNLNKVTSLTNELLNEIEENYTREGLIATPRRVAKALNYIYDGYNQDPKEVMTTFKNDTGDDSIVILKDIEFYSMCEHHMLPFYGKAHIAYIPGDKIIGISKLARILDIYARRLQIQERLGSQVTNFLMEEAGAKGAACVIEATHMCIRMRGVEKQNSVMTTSSMLGSFKDCEGVRQEFMSLIK